MHAHRRRRSLAACEPCKRRARRYVDWSTFVCEVKETEDTIVELVALCGAQGSDADEASLKAELEEVEKGLKERLDRYVHAGARMPSDDLLGRPTSLLRDLSRRLLHVLLALYGRLDEMEKNRKLNVDNIGTVVKDYTSINRRETKDVHPDKLIRWEGRQALRPPHGVPLIHHTNLQDRTACLT